MSDGDGERWVIETQDRATGQWRPMPMGEGLTRATAEARQEVTRHLWPGRQVRIRPQEQGE